MTALATTFPLLGSNPPTIETSATSAPFLEELPEEGTSPFLLDKMAMTGTSESTTSLTKATSTLLFLRFNSPEPSSPFTYLLTTFTKKSVQLGEKMTASTESPFKAKTQSSSFAEALPLPIESATLMATFYPIFDGEKLNSSLITSKSSV